MVDRGVMALGAVLVLALAVCATQARAQSGAVVEGRVTSVGGPPIQNALIELQGRPPIRARAGGDFRFEDVALGEYTLRVEAFGYATLTQSIVVDGDLSVAVELDVAPFELDSLVVAPERTDAEGQVRDAERGVPLRGAEVRTNQGHQVRTDNAGRFDLEVWDGTPLLVQVRAFGYFGVDTVVVPEPDSSFVFPLVTDPLVERLIATEIERIKERAGGRRAITMRPLDRDDLLRWDNATLLDVLRAEYSNRARRVRCVLVDEELLTAGMAGGVLLTTLARDVERIEFLFDGAMLRVYTRDFMRLMLGGGIELRRPTYVEWANPPMCT